MNQLTTIETSRLQALEDVVRAGLQTFSEVGEALLEIRDNRLYREEFRTFEEYCKLRWSMTRRHVNRLIESSSVVANLGPMGPKPDNERQIRPLAALPAEEQKEAWQQAVSSSPAGKPTAKLVQAAVNKLRGKPTCRVCGYGAVVGDDGMCSDCAESEAENERKATQEPHIQTATEEQESLDSSSPATSVDSPTPSESSDTPEDNSSAPAAPRDLEPECKREITLLIQKSLNQAHEYGHRGLDHWLKEAPRFAVIARKWRGQ